MEITMKIKILTLILILNLLGCGSSSSKEATTSLELPKIEMDIPEILIPSSNEVREIFGTNEKISPKIRYNKEEDEISIVYKEAKQSIYNTLFIFERYNNFQILMNPLIKKIQDKCTNTKENQVCSIEENSLEIELTTPLVDALFENMTSEMCSTDIKTLKGTKAFVGHIEFIKYSENSEYTYLLSVDNTSLRHLTCPENLDFLKKSTTQIKFNNNNTNIFVSISRETSDGEIKLLSLNYIKTQNVQEKLRMTEKVLNPSSPYKYIDNINLLKENNQDQTFKIFGSLLESELTDTLKYTHKAIYLLNLVNLNGFESFNSKEALNNELYYSYDDMILDTSGQPIAIRECSSEINCILKDKSTWEIDADSEDAFDNFNIRYTQELNLTNDENLKDGEYFLLSAEHNTSKLTTRDVFNNKVAEVIVLEDVKQAYLLNKAYENKLNELQWVYANYNDNLDGLTKDKNPNSFTLVPKEDVPTLKLF